MLGHGWRVCACSVGFRSCMFTPMLGYGEELRRWRETCCDDVPSSPPLLFHSIGGKSSWPQFWFKKIIEVGVYMKKDTIKKLVMNLQKQQWFAKLNYSAYRILWLSPCDKIAQNRVLWLFPNVLLVLKNYLPVTIIGLWLFFGCVPR